MSREAYLGIDLGTSGCRGIAIDAEGTILAKAQTPLPPSVSPHPQYQEQSPELWWQALLAVIRDIHAQLQSARLASIAIDGTSGTLLLCDGEGTPLSAGLMYNDARAIDEAARIAAVAPEETAATGPSSALAKLLWLQRHGPMEQARHALHQADWLANRLCGEYGISDINNCMKLGYDARAKEWPEWLDGLGVRRELLPRALRPGEAMGMLQPRWAKELGLDGDVAVIAGTTDSTAAIYASGATEPGEGITSLGSTLVPKVISERPVYAAEHGVYSQPYGDYWLVGGASNSGGAVLLDHFSEAQLQAMTPQLDPDHPTGLDYYPLSRPGERFPVNDPQFPPRLEPRPASDVVFFQAMLEGMARIEQHAYELLHELGAPYPHTVYSLGGGAKNRAWEQIRRGQLSVTVVTAEHGDAAYGTALLAARGASTVIHKGE